MPKTNTVRERILWEYAKLMADSAKGRTSPFFWQMASHFYRRLCQGELHPSSLLRENKIVVESSGCCAYCGKHGAMEWEHVIPRAHGGPDSIDNLVQSCKRCNLEKGARDPLEWYGRRRDEIPRLVMGKLLKLLLAAHDAEGTLDSADYPVGSRELGLLSLMKVFRPK